jgi:hypothetical protein
MIGRAGTSAPITSTRLGRRFGPTPWISRLLFVLLLMVVPGSQLLIYPVLWILMPAEETRTYAAPETRYPTV